MPGQDTGWKLHPTSVYRHRATHGSQKAQPGPKVRVTPLWIVATFVTLTETVLGLALTQVAGGVQVALTVFVIGFALLVATAFFFILWFRPYVFYSPSEFGNVDPKDFIDAMRGRLPDRVVAQIEMVEQVEARPADRLAQFRLIDSLTDESVRQFLILMHEQNTELPIGRYEHIKYEAGTKSGRWWGGDLSAESLSKKLVGTGLIELADKGWGIKLTPMGHEFAQWLTETGQRADFMSSSVGGWGKVERPEGVPSPLAPDGLWAPSFQMGNVPMNETPEKETAPDAGMSSTSTPESPTNSPEVGAR